MECIDEFFVMRKWRINPAAHHLFFNFALADLGAHQNNGIFAESEHVGDGALDEMPMTLVLLSALNRLDEVTGALARKPAALLVLGEHGLVEEQ